MSNKKFLIIEDENGGEVIRIPGTLTAGGVIVLGDSNYSISLTGLGLTTTGVSDALNKRFVSDAELADLQSLQPLAVLEPVLEDIANLVGAETLLASNAGVDLNNAATPTLFTVPAAKTAIITRIVIKGASISLDTWSGSFGWTSAAYADVIANATHTELTGPTLATILTPKAGALMGVAAATLKLKNNTLQGAAATADILVFGILF